MVDVIIPTSDIRAVEFAASASEAAAELSYDREITEVLMWTEFNELA